METVFLIPRMQSVKNFIEQLWGEPSFYQNISICKTQNTQDAKTALFPDYFHPALKHGLIREKVNSLYTHQLESCNLIRSGKNIVIVTGTASGKSLCYNIPVINDILINKRTRALYLFPTKALAHDQYEGIISLFNQILTYPETIWHSENKIASPYDGDTPKYHRNQIRQSSSIIITNPDMLHIGILPHHTQWSQFFVDLQYVIIDEIHTYRGVFGSHVCNVIRRLKRIAKFYGSDIQFLLTSATIGNPSELAENLIETDVTIIDNDGAPHGTRHFIIYNPPIINSDIAIRSSRFNEISKIAKKLFVNKIQTIIFCQTRRLVELLLILLHKELGDDNHISQSVRGYRSGYLPEHRRKLEKGLKNGDITIIVATTALELGIDCGQMDAVILDGFPGTISGTWQQAGRAGRKTNSALAILVASSNPLDQFLARNPNFLFEQNPERGLINPNNILILLDHVKCSLFELPFSDQDGLGSLKSEQLLELLYLLERTGIAYKTKNTTYWASIDYPANEVSLRNASASRYKLIQLIGEKERIIGEIDEESVFWMTHPEAIYLHEGNSFYVEELDIANHRVNLHNFQADYYTRPQQNREIELIEDLIQEQTPGGIKIFGELLIHEQVTGYQKIRWGLNEIMESIPLSLPKTELITTGFLFLFDKKTIDMLRNQGAWSNDPINYGVDWTTQKQKVLLRDGYTCQNCRTKSETTTLHVHHKIPLRMFQNQKEGNHLDNLITLCASCHKRAEDIVRIRSGLAGLAYILSNLAPLFLMCDKRDIGVHFDPQSRLNHGEAVLFIFDRISGGLGFSEEFYYSHKTIMKEALSLTIDCDCNDGCPACVGPGGEFGFGSKKETLALLEVLVNNC